MPIYEYRCSDCSHEFERMQKFSDPPVDTCPTCLGSVQKLISRSTFHLKGDGWYVTDYARKSDDAGGDSDGASKSNDSADHQSDTSTPSSSSNGSDSASTSTSGSGSSDSASTSTSGSGDSDSSSASKTSSATAS